MANVATLGARASFDVSGFNAGVNKMMDGLRAIKASSAGTSTTVKALGDTGAQSVQKLDSSFKQAVISGASFAATTAAINSAIGILRSGVNSLMGGLRWGAQLEMEAETAEMAFTVMLKSAKDAAKFMKDAEKFAIKTPFSQADVVRNAQMLKGMGIAADELLPTMKTLGDMAMGDAEKFGGLALAYGQVMAKGRLMAQEFNQIASRGIDLRTALASQVGVAVKDVAKAIEDGKVSATMFRNALIEVAETDFGGMMEATSETMAGKLNRIKEKAGLIFRDIAKGLFGEEGGAFKSFEKFLDDFRQRHVPAIVAALKGVAEHFRIIATNLDVMLSGKKDKSGGKTGVYANLGNSAVSLEEQKQRLDLIKQMRAGGASQEQIDAFIDTTKNRGGLLNAIKPDDSPLQGLKPEKDKPGASIAWFKESMKDAFRGSVGVLGPAIANAGQSLMVKGLKGTAFLQDAAGSMFAETPRQDMERKTGALEVGSASAYSEIIRHMFGGRNKESIDAKQLAEMKRTADGIAKLSQDLLTKGFKAFGVVNNLAGAGA